MSEFYLKSNKHFVKENLYLPGNQNVFFGKSTLV